jgi:hypothetical protein
VTVRHVDRFSTGVDVELAEDVRDVGTHGGPTDREDLRDLRV